jgi:A/G-specific adenine glycosylase
MDVDALLRWYEDVRRPLPWRFTRDPYAILVSEVMLQQTQAARVVPYYERFIARFPDARALADAEPADVLAVWSGLGYNRRALALQRAAIAVARDGWPRTTAALEALPGVGPYTAAAVASFAFAEDVLALDTNVRRVCERSGGAPAIPPGRGADLNQALMELGATVCRARSAACQACPLVTTCTAAAQGGPVIAPRRPAGARRRPRFEDTDRHLRGRVVAALVDGRPLPAGAARVLAGLERDGLVVRDAHGTVRLPAGRMAAADFDLVLEDPRGP